MSDTISPVPTHLAPENYEAIRYRMLYQEPYGHDFFEGGIQPTFTAQMEQVRSRGEPDAFLVTAYSAVPVADTIRGYYDTLGIACPTLGYIRADQLATLPVYRQKRIEEEVERLSPLLRNLARVCVVEQYVEKHRTLVLATEILRKIGITRIPQFASSNWYDDAYKALEDPESAVDLAGVSSKHRDFMYGVGKLAARSTQANNMGVGSKTGSAGAVA